MVRLRNNFSEFLAISQGKEHEILSSQIAKTHSLLFIRTIKFNIPNKLSKEVYNLYSKIFKIYLSNKQS